ncbi:hypothetical protein [Tannockella kyphosi]|uniref:hypothetical protein n=1 Tax=Tannockella kyphosi TaxID=2899121 RepID=UPI0020138A3B|nr:hypothetical protein [Tannockella kyphosi]
MELIKSEFYSDEKVVWFDCPSKGKGSKNIKAEIYFVLFGLAIIGCFVYFENAYLHPANLLGLFIIYIGVASAYKKLYALDRNYLDEYYCITNYRVFKYKESDLLLEYGSIENFDFFQITDCKDGYGTVYLSADFGDETNTNIKEVAKVYKQRTSSRNPRNIDQFAFYQIKNPETIEKIIENQRKQKDATCL